MTIGRKIYALIGFGFLGLLANHLARFREMASGLKQQKQIELQHLAELALGIVKDEQAAGQASGDPGRRGAEAGAGADRRAALRQQRLLLRHRSRQPDADASASSPQLNGKDMSDTQGSQRQARSSPRWSTPSSSSGGGVRRLLLGEAGLRQAGAEAVLCRRLRAVELDDRDRRLYRRSRRPDLGLDQAVADRDRRRAADHRWRSRCSWPAASPGRCIG